MSTKLDRRIVAETIRASLWFWPMLCAVLALIVTAVLLALPLSWGEWMRWLWPGDVQSATALFQVVATAVMTATTLTFSLTILALQLASQQFSPRLLREFARDRVTKSVLSVLISTFVVALTGLRGIEAGRSVPTIVVAVTFLLGVVSAGALLAFVGHIGRILRIDTMMVAVHKETMDTMREAYPEERPVDALPDAIAERGPGVVIHAERSGFVRVVDPDRLTSAARHRNVVIRLDVRPGDHVVAGAPIGEGWSEQPDGPAPEAEALRRCLVRAVDIGFERTAEQDVALGFRQLTDIAVKAISPSINDPVTAAAALAHAGDLIVRLESRRLGPRLYRDPDGAARLYVPDRDLDYYLDLVCAPVRRFGKPEPIVLTALMRLLRDAAMGAQDDRQREIIRRQAQYVLDDLPGHLLPSDIESVRDLGHRVELALAGDTLNAYRDRAGETRSQ